MYVFIGRTDVEAESLVLWPPDVKSWHIGKDSDAGKYWRQKEKGVTENEMVRQPLWLRGHEFEQTLRNSGRQRSLECCSPWHWKQVRHDWATEQQQDQMDFQNGLFSCRYGHREICNLLVIVFIKISTMVSGVYILMSKAFATPM